MQNTGGILRATGIGAKLVLAGETRVSGGDIVGTDGGLITMVDSANLVGVTVTAERLNGYILAASGNVALSDGYIANSTLDVGLAEFGTHEVSQAAGRVTFENVTFTANSTVVFASRSGADQFFFGTGLPTTITNQGALFIGTGTDISPTLNFPGALAVVTVRGEVTLDGGGTVTLSPGDGNPYNSGFVGDLDPILDVAHLINADNTITGSGFIGSGNTFEDPPSLRFTNHGTVRAEGDYQWLSILGDNFNYTTTNTGTIEAIDGGLVTISGIADGIDPFDPLAVPTLDNTGGVLRAAGVGTEMASVLELSGNNSLVQGGELIGENGGMIRLLGSNTNLRDLSVTLRNEGRFETFDFDYMLSGGSLRNVSFDVDETSVAELAVLNDVYPFVLENLSTSGRMYLSGDFVTLGTLTNTGELHLGSDFEEPGVSFSGGTATLRIAGEVTLSGGGTLRLHTGVDYPSGLRGEFDFYSQDTPHLINEDHLVTGSGFIGSGNTFEDPPSLRFTNHGTVQARDGDDLHIVSDASHLFTNHGRLDVHRGGKMTVHGPMVQAETGSVRTEIGGTVAGIDYSVLDIVGTAQLAGTYLVALLDNFVPTLGQSFVPVTWTARVGQFQTYAGFRLANDLVFQPTYDANGLRLTVTELSTGASQPLVPVANGGTQSVGAGGYYDGLTSLSTAPEALGTAATIIGGTASGSTNVSFNLSPVTGSFSAANGGQIASDVLSLSGTGSDKFVLQLDYDEQLVLSAFGTEETMFLAWFDTNLGEFVNSVFGNSDGGAVSHRFLGAYDSATMFTLGDYGVDTIANRVWAVIDHNSDFGAGGAPIVAPPASTAVQAWRTLHGLAANGAHDLGNPSGDGVVNLLKFAFNMAPNAGNLGVANVQTLPANGTAGLPFITHDAQGRLFIEFVRRKTASNPGLTYTVETGVSLTSLQPLDLSGAAVVSIDARWERVTVVDPTVTPQRFGRVRVASQ